MAATHELSLKVMRLSRPNLAPSKKYPFENNTLLSTSAALEKLASNLPAVISDVLLLPASFGNIYLGETFSSYLSINNDSHIAITNVLIKAELQTSSQRFTLTSNDTTSLLPAQSSEFIINHDIKELGIHILVASISYTAAHNEAKSFRKFYKFQVLNPLSVKTKVVNTRSKASVFLEAQIQNITISPMWLESVVFESSEAAFSHIDLTLEVYQNSYLKPQDIRQYLYKLTPAATGNTQILGKLDISWRTTFGQTGRLQTSQLSRKVVVVEPFNLDADSPPLINSEEPFTIACIVTNNLQTEADLKIMAIKSKMNCVLMAGFSEKHVGKIPAGSSQNITLTFFPLVSGIMKISGLRCVDSISGISTDIESLCEIFTYWAKRGASREKKMAFYNGLEIPHDSRLIMPSANGVANLGFLAVDLLIKNMDLPRIGYLNTATVEPVCALNAYIENSGILYTAFEVYAGKGLIIVQLRSPVVKLMGNAFTCQLLEWIMESKFKDILIMTGIDATQRDNFDGFGLISDIFLFSPSDQLFSNINASIGSSSELSKLAHAKSFDLLPPGAGLTRLLINQITSRALNLPVVALTYWASPGDNVNLALDMYAMSDKLFHLALPTSVKLPSSWAGLFGQELHTSSLY